MVPLTKRTRLATSEDLWVDRHYRGAIVMVGTKMLAIAEDAIRLVERVQRGELRALRGSEREELGETLEALLSMGVLRVVVDEESAP